MDNIDLRPMVSGGSQTLISGIDGFATLSPKPKRVFWDDKLRGGSFTFDPENPTKSDGGVWFNGYKRDIQGSILEIDPKWFGVKYSSMTDFTVEGYLLQKAIDFGNSERHKYGDAGFTIKIDGYIRINKTLTDLGRCLLQGQSTVLSRIIWTGGTTTNHDVYTSDDAVMLNWGSASWGGLSRIRIQGFDQHAGDTKVDGIDHVNYYDFVDFMHIQEDIHIVAGMKSCYHITATDASEHFTNFNITNLFFFAPYDGYVFDFDIPVYGSYRVLNIFGLTGGNGALSQPEYASPNTKGFIKAPSQVNIFIENGRLEYNFNLNNNFVFYYMTSAGTTDKPCNIMLKNIIGYLSASPRQFYVVNAPTDNVTNLTLIGSWLEGTKGIFNRDTGVLHNVLNLKGVNTNTLGRKVASNVVGNTTHHHYNFSDRNVTAADILVKKNDITFTNDGDGDILYYNIDDKIYSASGTGYRRVCKITINSGDVSGTFDNTDTGISLV